MSRVLKKIRYYKQCKNPRLMILKVMIVQRLIYKLFFINIIFCSFDNRNIPSFHLFSNLEEDLLIKLNFDRFIFKGLNLETIESFCSLLRSIGTKDELVTMVYGFPYFIGLS